MACIGEKKYGAARFERHTEHMIILVIQNTNATVSWQVLANVLKLISERLQVCSTCKDCDILTN